METPRGSTLLIVGWVAAATLLRIAIPGPVPEVIVAVMFPFALTGLASSARPGSRLRSWATLRQRDPTVALYLLRSGPP